LQTILYTLIMNGGLMSQIDYSSIFEAIEKNDIEAVNSFIKKGEADYGGWEWNALHEASKKGDIAIIELLLNQGGIPAGSEFEIIDHTDDYRGCALTEALLNGKLDAAKLLIQNGADVNATYYSMDMNTPQYFVGGSDLATQQGNCLSLALCLADEELLKLMLENGLKVDDPYDNEKNPFFYSIELSNLSLVKKLLDLGADINQTMGGYDFGYGDVSSLMFSILNCSPQRKLSYEVVEFLLRQGALLNLEVTECEDETILDLVFNKNDEILDKLFGMQGIRRRFADPNLENEENDFSNTERGRGNISV
jgi:ankyrin repeat protein